MNWEADSKDEYTISSTRHITEEETFFSHDPDVMLTNFKGLLKDIEAKDKVRRKRST